MEQVKLKSDQSSGHMVSIVVIVYINIYIMLIIYLSNETSLAFGGSITMIVR